MLFAHCKQEILLYVQEIKLANLWVVSNKNKLFNRMNKSMRLEYDLHMKRMALLTFPEL